MASLEDVFNHLVLPPRLPGRQDADIVGTGDAILVRLIQAANTSIKLAGLEQESTWLALRYSLRRFQSLHVDGRLEKQSLISEFRNLNHDESILFHIAEQNAALIIRCNASDETETVVFEAFEISPPSVDVVAAAGALVWDFPDCSAQVSRKVFQKPSFQDALADFLEKGSMEPLRCFQTLATKAQTTIVESRDPASPQLITHLLIPLLESIGSSDNSNTPRLRKRVRDDVNIDAAEFPWRRLPLWLALRVGIQRKLQLLLGNEAGRASYKIFVIVLLIELLNDCVGQLAPELTILLRAKICRRIAKLEQEKVESPSFHDQLFASAKPFFRENIVRVTELLESAWEKFKRDTTRRVPLLPQRADQRAEILSLPNSRAYTQGILNLPRLQKKAPLSLHLPSLQDSTIEQVEQFTSTYFRLAELESKIELADELQLNRAPNPQSDCTKLSEAIFSLFDVVGAAYDSNPEQASMFILSIFTLWVRMDKSMVKTCPLLLEYHPVFTPELLDSLHLPTAAGMRRLRGIQSYLQERCEGCKYQTTIFSRPAKKGFAVKYVAQCETLQKLHLQIEKASDALRDEKMVELENWWQEYDDLSLNISGGTCTCKVNHDGSRNINGCKKCWHWRTRNRMQIYAHEDFLPKDAVKAATVVFELGVPKSVAAYRNATWKILRLAYPETPDAEVPAKLLKDYEPLDKYSSGQSTFVTIASTSKSFRGTHYKVTKKRMKASKSDVIFPNGLNFCYFDMASNAWIKDFNKPLTFQHLCQVHVPPGLRSSALPASVHPPTEIDGPSSYDIVASETKCPSGMLVNEFLAYQRLLSGKNRRWLTMLVELGATHLNFSSESTMLMFNHLATQAGPAKDQNDEHRDVHAVFKDASFCECLATQIEKRLRSITTNWREVHCMEVLITLSLRLHTLGVSQAPSKSLLRQARHITLTWFTRLRSDVRNAKEAAVAKTAATFAFWAALLCRRTFSHLIEDSNPVISEGDLSMFVQGSLALQENLLVDLAKLPPVLKNMFVRDTKMAYILQPLLLCSIVDFPSGIGMAINASWSTSGSLAGKQFDAWQQLQSGNNRWVVAIMKASQTSSARPQVVHYNFIEGHLLIDGQPLGRLPRDIRESEVVKKLFGDHNLLTFPSPEYGMSYVVASHIVGHEIHFGFRNGQVIVRARYHDEVLEYIPGSYFVGTDAIDLPDSLITDCAHWLNLRSKCIEIRRKPSPWKTKITDWKIDLVKRLGHRNNRTLLIDPNSDASKQVTDIFRHFEDPRKITVFQPANKKGKLSAELRHLELSFFVNSRGLLECRELREEVDPDQDAGTLYGFQSKIVLRDITNSNRRSLIAPWGTVSTQRHGMHVAVRAAGTAEYAKFEIDDVLGRLSCPSEPRLLYAKAHFHAVTSFALPDPLTRRTGTEEALHILQSGCCQPWAPLGDRPINILKAIADISPVREYYPKNMRTLQTVSWKPRLTATIQHDAYENVVRTILHKSECLKVFARNTEDDIDTTRYIPSHLRQRGLAQRRIFDRSAADTFVETPSDETYRSRGQESDQAQARNVHCITNLIHTQPLRVHITKELSAILQDWQLIGGFHNAGQDTFASLSDMTDKNIDEQWGSLVNFCRRSEIQDPYSLMFRLCLMSLNPTTDMNAVQILAAFASLPSLKELEPPCHPSFNGFRLNEMPSVESLSRIISVDFPGKRQRKLVEAEVKYRKTYEAEGRRLATHLFDQWPCEEVSLEGFVSDVLDVGLAMERVVPEWHRLRSNAALSEYIIQVQDILAQFEGPDNTSFSKAWNWTQDPFRLNTRGSVIPSFSRDILTKSFALPLAIESCETPVHEDVMSSSHLSKKIDTKASLKESSELRQTLSTFVQSPDPLRRQYGRDLEASLDARERNDSQSQGLYPIPDITANARRIRDLRKTITTEFAHICDALSTGDDRFQWLHLGNLWPVNTSMAILEQLRSSSACTFGKFVKQAIVSHGVQITQLQRLMRIHHALYHNKHTRLQEELGNSGHENWDPVNWSDWLLLEIDSDILIRPEQIDVAHAIIEPKSQENTVLQLNMGKGKTSCIVPMAMAVLGDGKQLARLIVPKPLLLPTAQMIQSRLGGLVGREIRHIPFSRRTKLGQGTLQLYKNLHRELLDLRGVVLSAPEHILSFKLRGSQYLIDSEVETAREMISFQEELHSTCRDVLDESDVALAVKTQLIFPSGKQATVDGHPQRWQVAQSLLSLIKDHLPEIQRKFPQGIEVIERGHGFPMIHILQAVVEEELHQRIIEDICNGRAVFLQFPETSRPKLMEALPRILVDIDLSSKLLNSVTELFTDKTIAKKTLLLVRGLLRNRILLLCLKKRWNVQYGLHPNRDPMAVPFEAKGVPSEQAEFGHPDAAILFTCLAFYYSGLNQGQFSEALRHVLASHDPSSEFDRWTSSCDTLPEALHHWNVINIDDQGQLEELWKHLRISRSVLDHYMNHFVFPAHAKQFDTKLQASGWDLPVFSQTGAHKSLPKGARTTGFSGTNDNKMMLPLTIRQSDLPSLHQTNAEVLTYLLQERNRTYYLAAGRGKRLSEIGFLEQLMKQNIRVLIDAGAFILEMDNEALVQAWMTVDTKPPAAVFFGADNRAWVRYRGTKASVPLLATPFVENLENCLVYLDEAHTRGIDLKLPQYACGALTLALGQTKDHTVQAAMRLRQLATTQSVCFFAFPETHQSILDVCNMNQKDQIDSSHVVHWLLEQTCCTNEQLQSLYVSQGTDFCNRINAEWENAAFLTDLQDRAEYVKVLQRPEQQTLEELYGSCTEDVQRSSIPSITLPQLRAFTQKLSQLRRDATSNSNVPHCSALEEVEQEREVEFQVEEVREVQKMTHYTAHSFPGLHSAISDFVRTGMLSGDVGYERLFDAVSHTSISKKFNVTEAESELFVSAEFMKTIKMSKDGLIDNFLRPVEWILYSPVTSNALVIIAEEAEVLVPALRASGSSARVHLLTYSAPITKKMLHFSNLRYYAIPTLPQNHVIPTRLTIELGIFAGRLYMNFDECAPLMEYIEGTSIGRQSGGPFTEANSFVLEWLSLRRKGQDIMHTPMAYVCQRRSLSSDHAFFVTHAADGTSAITSCGIKEAENGVQQEGYDDEEVDDDGKWEDS